METLDKSENYICELCTKTFTVKSNLKRHVLRAHEYGINGKMDKYDCEVCAKTFTEKSYLQKHILRVHDYDDKSEKMEKHNESDKYVCEVCAKTFKVKSNLERHIIKVHENGIEGVNFDNHNKSDKYVCEVCAKTFTVKSNLERHILRAHSESSDRKEFLCQHCARSYSNKHNLIRHIASCNKNQKSKELKCVLCRDYTGPKKHLLKHYNEDHDINIMTQNLQFDNFLEFEEWKDDIEKYTVSKYAKNYSVKTNDKVIYYYRCHRDGFYQGKGKHMRRLKLKGTVKIDGYCPAKIDAMVLNGTGKVQVVFVETHVGHTMDLGKIPLKKSDRELLASKISQKVPFDDILKTVKSDSDNSHSRMQLLTKKDLFNIKQLYNLKDESDVEQVDECPSVEPWVVQSLHEEESVWEEPALTSTTLTSPIRQYKTKVSQVFKSILDFASTIEDYKVIEKALTPILPTLEAMHGKAPVVQNNVTTPSITTTRPSKTKKRKFESPKIKVERINQY